MTRFSVGVFASGLFAALAGDFPSLAAATPLQLPAGTKVSVVLTKAIGMKMAKAGDGIFGRVNFPVILGNQVAIPAGTDVQGVLDIVNRPSYLTGRAEVRIRINYLIFRNNYIVELPAADESKQSVTNMVVAVSRRSDVLLDNGTQFDFTLGQDMTLIGPIPASETMPLNWRSSSRCVPTRPHVIPGTPGTPPVVIPGAPSSPPVVIPNTPGSHTPPVVIPGSPGSPDVIIPGTPGTASQVLPGAPCPAPPVTVNEELAHKESFQVKEPFAIGGLRLPKGHYELSWTGLSPITQVVLRTPDHATHRLAAHIVGMTAQVMDTKVALEKDARGQARLSALRFRGQGFELQFR